MKRILCWILAFLTVVSCAPADALGVYAAQEEQGITVCNESVVADPGFLDEEELLNGYLYQLFYGNAVTYRRKAGDLLTGNEKIVYDAVVPIIKQIAFGERSSTVIGIGQTVETAQGLFITDVEVSFEGTDIDIKRLYNALLADLSYELYWLDITSPTWFDPFRGQALEHIQIKFPVSGNYRGSEEYSVDFQLARAAVAAAGKSAAIVSKYADCTDYEKLLGYKNEICFLTDYGYGADFGGSYSADNDPWQLIHVFDGDDSTKVVCEGYAKAFAYLCEQTDFAGDVSCITVSGYTPGGHMWNIVTLEEKNYLVDVTNSDGAAIGWDGSLFLAGGVGSIAEGFRVGDYHYWYIDPITDEPSYDLALWGDGPDSILNLAPESYVPAAAPVVASGYCNEQIQWSLDTTGTLTLTGTGDIPDYPLYGAPWYEEYKESVKKVVVEEDIRFIGDYVFAALPNLTCVILSGSVVCIGVGIFQNCTSLSDVWLPVSLLTIKEYAFAGCTALERIELPMPVLGIGDGAFSGCTALRKVNIPFQVHDIGATTFDRCNSLEVIRLPDDSRYYSRYYSIGAGGALYDINQQTLYKVPAKAVSGHYVIPDSVTDIGASAFSDCAALTAVTIPGSVTAIGENAFGRCTGLTDVYYVGTYEQWQQIQISQGNQLLTAAQLHFVECENHQTIQYAAQAPTCTEPGWNAYEVCSVCGHSNYQEILATGHTLFPYAGKEPTCTEYGWEPYGICEKCDYSSYQEIPAHGHSFVEYEAKAPTCTEYGWNAYGVCQVCDHSTYVEIPSPGHRYEDIICTVCGGEAEILESGSCGSQVSWEMRDGGILLIFGSGDMENFDGQYDTPWADYTSEIKVVLIREGVTSIGESAFSQCQALVDVNIASTVERIGHYAFSDCDGLTDVVIGDNVTEIGYHAFDHCNSLKTVTMGSGVAKIRDAAFDDCPKLLEYRVSSNNESYSNDERGVLFNKDKTVLIRVPGGISGGYAIPSGVVSIDEGGFSGCVSLTDVTVPETLTGILASTFEDCSSLQYNLHNGVQYLGSTDNPYYILMKPGTDLVAQLQIHPDTKMIADEAFYDSQSLLSVTIPGSVTSIGRHAFGSCTGLTSLTIENGVQVIGDYAFSSCEALATLTIPDSVTAVGKHAFGACTGLTSVKMGKGVKTIGENAFILCTGLSDFTIGEGVSTIEQYAFFYCTGLTSVTIPTSVMEIGGSAFKSCGNLRDVYYWGSEQQWARIDIQADHSWVNEVNLHFNAGHTHNFENLTCTICGYKAVDLTITNVTLRPDCAGLYYSGSFHIEKDVDVARMGIAVSIYNDLPVADGTDPHSLWSEGTTSVLLSNILNADYDDVSNVNRAAMRIYARAYVELEDGTYIYSEVVSMNLKQVVEAADAQWTSLGNAQNAAIVAMYTKFRYIMSAWNIPNLKQNGTL